MTGGATDVHTAHDRARLILGGSSMVLRPQNSCKGPASEDPRKTQGPHATLKTKGFLFYEQEGTRDTSQLVSEIRVSF